jgi:hypothetical protein
VRKLRNSVIRSNFGVEGLRRYRALARQKRGVLKQRRHVLRALAAQMVEAQPGILDKVTRWLRKRKLRKLASALEQQALGIGMKQLVLVNPEFARGAK